MVREYHIGPFVFSYDEKNKQIFVSKRHGTVLSMIEPVTLAEWVAFTDETFEVARHG